MVHSVVDGHRALLLPVFQRARPLLALRPTSPDGMGTTAPTSGDHSLSRQLTTKAVAQGEASDPSVEALQPRLLLRLRCPDTDSEGGYTEIRCMLPLYISNVSDVLEVCCKYFIRMLQK
jgi:hypothetical protein